VSTATVSSPCQRFEAPGASTTTGPLVSRSSARPSGTFAASSTRARVPRSAVMAGEVWRSSGNPE